MNKGTRRLRVSALITFLMAATILPAFAEPAYLGIAVSPDNRVLSPTMKQRYGVEGGALVEHVQPNSSADAADIRVGDLIVSVQGQHVVDWDSLKTAIQSFQPGTEVRVGLLRGDKQLEVKATLGSQPAPAEPAPRRRRPAITLGTVLRAFAAARAQQQEQQNEQQQEQLRQYQDQQQYQEQQQQYQEQQRLPQEQRQQEQWELAQQRYLQAQQFQREQEMLRLNWLYRPIPCPPRVYTAPAPAPPLTLPRIWQATKEIGGALLYGGAEVLGALLGK